MKETSNFIFAALRVSHTFDASTNEIIVLSFMKTVPCCRNIEAYKWNSTKNLILIYKGVVVVTLHSILKFRLLIISLFNRVAD